MCGESSTAVEIAGQRTMTCLARVLGVRVVGTRKSQYCDGGFTPLFDRLLIDAAICHVRIADYPTGSSARIVLNAAGSSTSVGSLTG